MSRPNRFERLESQRRGVPVQSPPSQVEERFGSEAAPAAAVAPADSASARSGGQPARFEEKQPGEELRLLELDDGQPFVRCAQCRYDHHATALRCTHCGADLTTRDQRAFNEALWKSRMEEKADADRELERLRASQAESDRELAAALRDQAAFERELERRRSLGPRAEDYDQRDSFALARRTGRAIGLWLRRVVPNRGLRFLVVGALAVLLVALFVEMFGLPSRLAVGYLVLFAVVNGIVQFVRRLRR